MSEPAHGWTKLGYAVHEKTMDHISTETPYQRFNKKVALAITSKVGTMTCAYVFAILALCSFPAILSGFYIFHGVFPDWMVKASIVSLVAWVAQAFLQLVLLSVIMVGQAVQATASDARAAKTFEDTEKVLNLMDINTEGGLKDIADLIKEQNKNA